jgi:hypothetical protein
MEDAESARQGLHGLSRTSRLVTLHSDLKPNICFGTMNEDRQSPDPRYGPWKFVEEIKLADLQAHPIWLWCTTLNLPDEEDGPLGGDETSMRPLLDSSNVTGEMSQPLILLQVKGTDYFASGLYDHPTCRVLSICIQTKTGDEVTALTRVGGLRVPAGWSAPLRFVAVPRIERRDRVEFVCDTLDKDEARVA